MKKFLTLLAIVIVGLTSCKTELVVYSISIDPTELSFNSGGGEETVSVTSTADWELSGDSYWCYASAYSGKGDAEIIFTADPNEDSESNRSATFTFISGDKKATLTVTQEKKEYSISIEPKELKFGAEGGEQEITITSSDEWEVKGESDWCDLSLTSGKNGDKVTFSVDSYTNTEEARTATYTFICGDKEAELKIEQEAKVYSISVEPMELSFIAAGEEKTVTITSSDEWEFSSDKNWIHSYERYGENGASVRIIVDENDAPEIRTGIATFKCGDKQADVKITQEAKEFSISIEPTEIEFEAEGGEHTITVTSSDRWTLSTDNDWITTSTKSGENGSLVNITIDYTTSTEVRTGIITFTCGNKTAEFTVTQNPDNSPIIQFKDPYFLEALLDRDAADPLIDRNGDGQISEKEAKIVTALSLVGRARNVDELAYFSDLKSIYINCPEIESINLSNRTCLESVSCSNSKNLDLSGCVALNTISTSGVENLNLSGCIVLKEFKDKTSRDLISLNLSGCASLTKVELNYGVSSLDLRGCTALTSLDCSYNNNLSELKLGNNTALTEMNLSRNRLTTLDLSECIALTSLRCGENSLIALDLSKNTALTYLRCEWNDLTSLDLSNNTMLTDVDCSNNDLTALDLSNNTMLTGVDCHENQLTILDLSECTALTYLMCEWNDLTSLDLRNNTMLAYLRCYYNKLTSLDLSNNTTLTYLNCKFNPLQKLILYKYHIIEDDSMKSIESSYGDIIEYVE